MRFTIKRVGSGSERVGRMTGFSKSPGAIIETPTSALFTQGASVVHLTADVLARVFPSPQLLWVPLSNTYNLENGVKAQGEGIAKFAALPQHVFCSTLHGVSESTPSGHFEVHKVPLWTKNGKKMFTADRYMDMMEVFKPDIVLAIADGRTSLSEGLKRMGKAIERSNNMLEICVQRYKSSDMLKNHSSLIGVIVGTALEDKCNSSIKHILKYQEYIDGITLAGLTDGIEDITCVPTEQLRDVFKRVDKAVPKDLVRIVEGCWNPAVVVTAIDNGWDVFDGSYPLKLSNDGQALALNFNVNQKSTELCILHLSDKSYREEFSPIVQDCKCLACKNHTRAYIRHLLNTREMLANVLLNMHNLHHFDQLFHHARLHIAADTFSTFKQHITRQYEKYQSSQKSSNKCDNDTMDLNKVQENGETRDAHTERQGRKKFRVSNGQRNVNGSVVSV